MDVAAERRRLSRRGFLAGSARLGAGAALALSLGSALSMRQLASAQELKSDLDVLNYALTLEHLEAAFYRDGLAAIGSGAFGDDSRGGSIDDAFAAIRDHEAEHVTTLTKVITDLGGSPVEAATYDFGDAFSDATTFMQTAMALENTGVSAYDGAAQFLSDPDLLTAAGSIVAVEARHASYLNLLNGEVPFPAPFETPLSPEDVLKIAKPFFVS
jgi:rubrerythrin